VVDLGTGSGAIALALATERPDWSVTATDISTEALAIARSNAAMLRATNIELLQGSWYGPLAGRRFDLIVSNPPYIANDDPALLQPALKYEPRLALTPPEIDPAAANDGMACLKALVRLAPDHLERGGWLILEHGADQAAALTMELVARGFRHVRSHRDLAGHERITEAS
jgi:release factor glutamine methyltransferase